MLLIFYFILLFFHENISMSEMDILIVSLLNFYRPIARLIGMILIFS